MSSATVYPSASAVDGYVGREGVTDFWANIRGGDGNNFDYTTATGLRLKITAYASTSDTWNALRRVIVLFDPSPLPTGSIITSATVSVKCSAVTADSLGSDIVLTNAPVTSPTSLVDGDYQRMVSDPVEYGTARVAVSSLAGGSYTSWTLNSTALAALNTSLEGGGVLELGLMYDFDFDNSSPTWDAALADEVIFFAVDQAGTTSDPYLTISYRVGLGNNTIVLKGTKSNSADTITADTWAIEVFT